MLLEQGFAGIFLDRRGRRFSKFLAVNIGDDIGGQCLRLRLGADKGRHEEADLMNFSDIGTQRVKAHMGGLGLEIVVEAAQGVAGITLLDEKFLSCQETVIRFEHAIGFLNPDGVC